MMMVPVTERRRYAHRFQVRAGGFSESDNIATRRRLAVSFPPEVFARVMDLAYINDRSFSAQVVAMIDAALSEQSA